MPRGHDTNVCARCTNNGVRADVVRLLKQPCQWHGQPRMIRSGNGPEFRSHVAKTWVAAQGIERHFTEPRCPAKDAYIERFTGTYRREVMDAYQLDHSSSCTPLPVNGSPL
jgi:transposase InsO family protein